MVIRDYQEQTSLNYHLSIRQHLDDRMTILDTKVMANRLFRYGLLIYTLIVTSNSIPPLNLHFHKIQIKNMEKYFDQAFLYRYKHLFTMI
jgi:hypothetical protein